MPLTVADVIVSALHDAGVRAIFGVPGGGSNLDLIDAAGRAGLPFVLTATETAAAIAAIAQAEITGRPGVCATGLGPGAASVVNGVACASLERAPLIVLTDAHPASGGPFEHQRIDQRALLSTLVRWSATLTADNAAAVMTEAVARATAHPAGPVHLELPGDAAQQTVELGSLKYEVRSPKSEVRSRRSAGGRLRPSDFRLQTSNFKVPTARRPLVLCGLGARDRESVDAIRSFCASHHVPAMVTYKAKGVVPDGDIHFAGVFTNGALEQEIAAQSDLLIAVGLDRVELLPRPWTFPQPLVEIAGDVASQLRALTFALAPSDWDLTALQRTIAGQRHRLQSQAGALSPDRVVRVASRASGHARVTVDAGAHMFPATLLWPVDEPNQMLISNGLSTMGFAVPAAIGAAVLDRGRPVVALTGDGGLLMCAGELATLARERLSVVVIVFNDRSLSLIEVKQRQRRFVRAGVAVGDVDWAVLAAGFGLTARAASTDDDLATAIAAALGGGGPFLIDARVDPSGYDEIIRLVRG